MSEFIQTLSEIDRNVALWRSAAIPFICLCDRLILLGAYNVTETHFSFRGVTYPHRSL